MSKRYIWTAILDSSTCSVCQGRHLKVYEKGKGPREPAHPLCRCSTSPYSDEGGAVMKETFLQWLKRQAKSLLAGLMSSKAITVKQYAEKVKRYVESKTK